MERRTFLTATTATLIGVAGCASDSEQSVGDDTTSDVDASGTTNTAGSTNTTDSSPETTEPESDTETETETQTASGAADINIKSKELVVDEGEYTTDKYVAAEIANEGEARSGPIELTAEWYDADGNYLDNDNAYLQTLGGGETWAARVYAIVDEEKIDDFELKGGFTEEPPNFDPDGLSVGSSELKVGENEAVVTGTVENTREESVDYIQAIATIYNADGVVLGDNYTNTTEVPAGRNWSFETSWRGRDRTSEADSHEVHMSDSVL